MENPLDEYYIQKPEPVQSSLLGLRKIILDKDSEIGECQKYGMPCFCYGKKAMCYLWTDKKTGEPYLLFVEGQQMNNPLLEKGDRARMAIFRVSSKEDLPIDSIHQVLEEAIQFYRK